MLVNDFDELWKAQSFKPFTVHTAGGEENLCEESRIRVACASTANCLDCRRFRRGACSDGGFATGHIDEYGRKQRATADRRSW